MNDSDTSIIELAKMHASFLTSVGSALLAVLGIVTGLTQTRARSPITAAVASQKQTPAQAKKIELARERRGFLTNLFCLIMISFAGAQCMAEVGGNKADSEKVFATYASYYHLFTVASVLVYLAAIGFAEVLHCLAIYLDEEDAAGSKQSLESFVRIIQIIILFVVVGYSVQSAQAFATEPRLTNYILPSWWLVYVGPTVLTVCAFVFQHRRVSPPDHLPRAPMVQLAFGALAFAWFVINLRCKQRITDIEISCMLAFVWITSVVSLWPAEARPKKAKAATQSGKDLGASTVGSPISSN